MTAVCVSATEWQKQADEGAGAALAEIGREVELVEAITHGLR